jgi:23S rRNA pseudouridine1911/1915/1917 synthase
MPERFVLASGQARERVDKVLARLLAPRSRSTIQRWIQENRVSIDGAPCRPKDFVRGGSVLLVEPGPEPTSSAEPDASVPFEVLFEDSHLIVVNKPPGVVVHPARGHRTGTLVSGLLARPGFASAPADERDPDGRLRPGIVHRIDKDTSGILVVAKDAVTREGLKRQLAEHSMRRIYNALTLGVPRAGRIETWYGRHPRSRLKFTSRLDAGKRAVTSVSVLDVLQGGAAAFVECRLETGRTHQIRVHLAEQAGTPLLADALYGSAIANEAVRRIAAQLGRQALHARVLGFQHPVTGEGLSFDSGLPPDLSRALALLKGQGQP